MARHHLPEGGLGLVAAVAAGGAAGSVGRWGVSSALPSAHDGFPWGTTVVNLSGALLMGLLVAWLTVRPGTHPFVRPVLGVGVLGGWTTFSALALDAHDLLTDGRAALAAGYLAVAVIAGTCACGLGLALGARLWPDIREERA
ncbi:MULTISPECIES: fluoride efflux transporter FluC [unclassified Janibacter]|uniref:fluoride efflux transporter FluC n=1 Tax=unclassified Janibacter TaxID=2649294 RepID=UPI003CFEB5C9